MNDVAVISKFPSDSEMEAMPVEEISRTVNRVVLSGTQIEGEAALDVNRFMAKAAAILASSKLETTIYLEGPQNWRDKMTNLIYQTSDEKLPIVAHYMVLYSCYSGYESPAIKKMKELLKSMWPNWPDGVP